MYMRGIFGNERRCVYSMGSQRVDVRAETWAMKAGLFERLASHREENS